MHTQKKELDRTFFKTHQSRSIKFSLNTSTGFTLIELLVVISIIALLSTVVLAAVGDARVKAGNTAKNEVVLQYINALELYASSHNGVYPDSNQTSGNFIYSCLGFKQTDGCFKTGSTNIYTGFETLNSSLESFYSGVPKSDTLIISAGTAEWKGIMYMKYNSEYKLLWYLRDKATCVRGAQTTSSTGKTLCTYPK